MHSPALTEIQMPFLNGRCSFAHRTIPKTPGVSTASMGRLIRSTSRIFTLYNWQHPLVQAVSKGKTSSLSFAKRMRAGAFLVLQAAHSLRG